MNHIHENERVYTDNQFSLFYRQQDNISFYFSLFFFSIFILFSYDKKFDIKVQKVCISIFMNTNFTLLLFFCFVYFDSGVSQIAFEYYQLEKRIFIFKDTMYNIMYNGTVVTIAATDSDYTYSKIENHRKRKL